MTSTLSSMRTWILVHAVALIVATGWTIGMDGALAMTDDGPLFAPWTGLEVMPEWGYTTAYVALTTLGLIELAALLGMYFHRRWGRALAIPATLLNLGSQWILPAVATSSVVAGLWEIAALALGGAIYAEYWGPSADRFVVVDPPGQS